MTKISPKLPEGERNGLGKIAEELIHNPHKVHTLIVQVDCLTLTTDVDSGDVVPTARIRRIEPVYVDDINIVRDAMLRGYAWRTGKSSLWDTPPEDEEPDDPEEPEIDPETGEVKIEDLPSDEDEAALYAEFEVRS